ncbi:MAG: DnaJ domain-containing protein [Rhizobiales bacterium]|nr:DnaJ domain-containing protein [Hyphomicrobiales bacterium]
MSVVLGVLAAIGLLAALAIVFMRADPRTVAAALRLAGPVAAGTLGAGLMLVGREALGGMLISGAVAWYGILRRRAGTAPMPGRHSTVRTAALEMELDHDTGGLEGLVLAGRHEGKSLGGLDRPDLLDLYAELASDIDTRQLLETYLDGRFPGWREDLKADARHGQGAAPGSGAMTKEEAYKVLGLETGASAADVRQAHRRLMQRLHPDIGGSPFLAARINEAKDVLLSDHN